ncbi:MAG: nuclear transport factor 2 family protein [Myxococcales bacterium]|nr:nuclear transport factor 2 family protein [Myxococcales bacterium]
MDAPCPRSAPCYRQRVSTVEAEVLAANAAFYAAFAERDIERMLELWASDHAVACIHPGWQILRGHAQVAASWRAILENPGAPAVEHRDAAASVIGDTAIVTCTEELPDVELAATNVFARESGAWKLVHHQAGPSRPHTEPDFDPGLLN